MEQDLAAKHNKRELAFNHPPRHTPGPLASAGHNQHQGAAPATAAL